MALVGSSVPDSLQEIFTGNVDRSSGEAETAAAQQSGAGQQLFSLSAEPWSVSVPGGEGEAVGPGDAVGAGGGGGMVDCGPGTGKCDTATHGSLISSAFLSVFEHRFAEHTVEPGLIAPSLLAEPSHHIGVQAHGELPLHRPVQRIPDSVFPETVFERRDIRIIDLRIRALGELSQFALARGSSRAVRQCLAHEFGHNGFVSPH